MKQANPLLLGQIAVREGCISPQELEECLRAQTVSDPPRKLGAVLVERGHLTPEKLKSLMEIQRLRLDTIASDPERGGLFGQIALRLGCVTQLQLDECLREQQSSAQDGSPVLLGQILLRKAYITTDQFLQILGKQRREVVKCPGCDTSYDAHDQTDGAKFVCTRCGTVVQIPFRQTEQRTPGDGGTQKLLRQALQETRGEMIGRYVILEQIGQGGMGVVYKALHRDLNRIFALKVLKSGDLTTFDTIRRFQREARLAAKLKHPHIVSVHDAGEEEGIHYLAMEYIEGEPLSARIIARRGRLRENVVLMEKVVRAVAYAHAQGVIHRDLKPANVMMDAAGEPHIMDFGLAKHSTDGSFLTRTGAFLGTAFYMSPEQIQGDGAVVDGQSDVYSLGVMLYEVLSGKLPHGGENSAEIFNKIIHAEPIDIRKMNAKIHPDLETLCMKALEKDRNGRYSSAEAMADELRRHLEGEPILARPIGPLAHLWRRLRKNPAVAVAAVALLLLAVTGGVLLFSALRSAQRYDDHVAQVRIARDRGDLDLAKSELEQALAVRPGDSDATRILLEILEQVRRRKERGLERERSQGRREKAAPRIQEARKRLEEFAARGDADVSSTCAQAEKLLDEALAICPGHEEALLWMARSRLLRGDLEGALRHLDEACRDQIFDEALLERGRLLLRQYRRPRGLPEVLIREDRPLFTDPSPDSPAAIGLRARARIDLEAVRARTEVAWMHRFAEAALEFLDARFEAAEERLTSYLQDYPSDAEALALRGLSRLYRARPDAALADLTLALRSRPADGFLRDWRAVARFLMNDAPGALEDLQRPDADASTLQIRGALRHARGDFREALADFQKAVEASPHAADPLAGRAAAQAALDRLPEADEDYSRAIALAPGEPAYHESRGLLRLRAGRRAEAARDLERAIELSPSRRARVQPALDAARKS